MRRPKGENFAGLTAVSLSGPVIWSLHFGVVYGAQHVACATGAVSPAFIGLFIAAATLAALAIIIVIGLKPARFLRLASASSSPDVEAFFTRLSRALILLSAAAIVWTGAATLFISACLPMR